MLTTGPRDWNVLSHPPPLCFDLVLNRLLSKNISSQRESPTPLGQEPTWTGEYPSSDGSREESLRLSLSVSLGTFRLVSHYSFICSLEEVQTV